LLRHKLRGEDEPGSVCAAGIEPVTVQVQRTAGDQWSARMAASGAGRWTLGLGITLAPTNIVNIAAPVLIY